MVARLLRWLDQGWEDFLRAEYYWLLPTVEIPWLDPVKQFHQVTDCTKCVYGDIAFAPKLPVRKLPPWRLASRRFRR